MNTQRLKINHKINHHDQKLDKPLGLGSNIQSKKMWLIGALLLSITALILILSQQNHSNTSGNDDSNKNSKQETSYVELNQNRLALLNLKENNEEDIINPQNIEKFQDQGELKKLNESPLAKRDASNLSENNANQPTIKGIGKNAVESLDNLIKAPLLDSETMPTTTISHKYIDNKQIHKFSGRMPSLKNINNNNTINEINYQNNKNNENNESNQDLEKIAQASLRLTDYQNDAKNNDKSNALNNIAENLINSGFEMKQRANLKSYQSTAQKQKAKSEYELKAGSFIFAMLNHQITSDIQGEVSAMVTQDVYDSTQGVHLLIPKGTKINGSYENQITFGQNRLAVTWHRLIFSDGSVLDLENMPASDAEGNQGMKDLADHHYLKTFGGAILSSILASGVNLQQNQSSWLKNGQNNLDNQVLEKTSSAAQNLIDKTLDNQSTLVIRPGYRFSIKVNKDLVIE